MGITECILVATSAFLIGFTKAGLKGLGIVVVALMVIVFGAKQSTGVLVPLLICGDVLSVVYYRRHARWSYLSKFLPAMILGILIAVLVGNQLDELSFKKWMGIIVVISVVIMFIWERSSKKELPNNWLLSGSTGVAAGFTTMIGNLAGAFANMFFLATRLPKNEIIGTSAWLFLIINVFKVPFHIWSWKTITLETLIINLKFAPFILVGFWIGIKIVALINEQFYRYFLLVVTAIGALIILF